MRSSWEAASEKTAPATVKIHPLRSISCHEFMSLLCQRQKEREKAELLPSRVLHMSLQ